MIGGGRRRKQFSERENQTRVSTFSVRARAGLPSHRVRLKPLNQDAVEERHDSLDAFESCLVSLQDASTAVSQRNM